MRVDPHPVRQAPRRAGAGIPGWVGPEAPNTVHAGQLTPR